MMSMLHVDCISSLDPVCQAEQTSSLFWQADHFETMQECQEKEGVFMMAFETPVSALEWALTLQLALIK